MRALISRTKMTSWES